MALVASSVLFGAGVAVGRALAPRSVPAEVYADVPPAVAEGMRLGLAAFTEGKLWRAADEFVRVLSIEPENHDAQRMFYVTTELAALEELREGFTARVEVAEQREGP